MRKGIYGILSNVSDTNFTFRLKAKKQKLKRNAYSHLSGFLSVLK